MGKLIIFEGLDGSGKASSMYPADTAFAQKMIT